MILQYIKNYARLIKWHLLKHYSYLIDFLTTYKNREEKMILVQNTTYIYQCQWASPHLVKSFISKEKSPLDDPQWQEFGFKTKKEYAFWSWRICAIACLKMVTNYYYGNNKVTLATLTKRCLDLNGYSIDKDRGWFHSSLITYLREEKIFSSSLTFIPWHVLLESLQKNILIIASISESNKTINPLLDGHLVILVGIENSPTKKGIYYLDPSNPPARNKPSYMSWKTFQKVFLMKGIKTWINSDKTTL